MLNETRMKADDQSGDSSKPYAHQSATDAAVYCATAELAAQTRQLLPEGKKLYTRNRSQFVLISVHRIKARVQHAV